MTDLTNKSLPTDDCQEDALQFSIGMIASAASNMKRCLDMHKLMDALKHASTMLAELRSSSLSPKHYYELYMAIFDQLRHLTTFLFDAHLNNTHHLSDLYELVQYAGNIVPRLYLMITVGSVYMHVSKINSKNIRPPSNRYFFFFFLSPPRLALLNLETLQSDQQLLNENPDQSSIPPDLDLENINKQKPIDEDDTPPIKELMRDMLEMSRGYNVSFFFLISSVQHPTRGLFLRYYLSAMTRDYLPDGLIDGPNGSIHDSIHFILQNFIEMNKLWVRLQHQGHSREREKREQERRELRLLVGSNLVRLSQLDSLDVKVYQTLVLPSILEEIVNCKDVIAQDYLMEVIIQVFPDDFHLKTLDPFLSATAQLQRNVNVKQIVISLIDRFSSYATRSREENNKSPAPGEEKSGSPNLTSGGIPADVQLFDVFWFQITELIKARPEFSIQYIIALLVSLINLSLNCYPEQLEYVDNVLGFAKQKLIEAKAANDPDVSSPNTRSALLKLLLSPIQAYKSATVDSLLNFPSSSTKSAQKSECLAGNYSDLLYMQPFTTRRQISHVIAATLVDGFESMDFRIKSIEGVNLLFGELGSCMVRDQVDGGLFGPKMEIKTQSSIDSNTVLNFEDEVGTKYTPKSVKQDESIGWSDVVREQEMVARLVHIIENRGEDGVATESDLDEDFKLLSAARKHFGEGGEIRIRFTLPPLVIATIKLARKYGKLRNASSFSDDDSSITPKLQSLYKFIHQTITTLLKAREHFSDDDEYTSTPLFGEDSITRNPSSSNNQTDSTRIGFGLMSPPEMGFRLFLIAAQSADETLFEELSYEFFVQAFTIYEESISESRAQSDAITLIVGTLQTTKVFGYENYETLITKCAVHSSRLLKRVDQCRGVVLVSHLFWCEGNEKRAESKPAYRDGKRVLECMQKALKIADSVMDRYVSVELFIEVLERCVWFYEKKNEMITMKYLNSLIDLIQTNLASMPTSSTTSQQYDNTHIANNNNHHHHHTGLSFNTIGPLNNVGAIGSLFSGETTRTISDSILKHFKNIVKGIQSARDGEANSLDKKWAEVETGF